MDMLAALRLQIEWGADEALQDMPVDRMAPPARPDTLAASLPAERGAPRMAETPRIGPVARAEAAAAGAHTLEALHRVVAGFSECSLAATATKMALSDGNPASGLVLVGEAPGAAEDLAGRPFAGPAGQMLDRMLACIGLSRGDLVLINMIPWRPPGGRAPTDTEVQICTAFLWRHLTLLRPHTLVSLGTLPGRVLTGRQDSVRRLRGSWQTVSVPGLPAAIPVLPMLHPDTLQRTPALKKAAWADLIALAKHLAAK